MKIQLISIAFLSVVTLASPVQAGLLSSLTSFFHDCQGICEKNKIKCSAADPSQKGSVGWCQNKCLGSNKKAEEVAKYQEGIDSCLAPVAGPVTNAETIPAH